MSDRCAQCTRPEPAFKAHGPTEEKCKAEDCLEEMPGGELLPGAGLEAIAWEGIQGGFLSSAKFCMSVG